MEARNEISNKGYHRGVGGSIADNSDVPPDWGVSEHPRSVLLLNNNSAGGNPLSKWRGGLSKSGDEAPLQIPSDLGEVKEHEP